MRGVACVSIATLIVRAGLDICVWWLHGLGADTAWAVHAAATQCPNDQQRLRFRGARASRAGSWCPCTTRPAWPPVQGALSTCVPTFNPAHNGDNMRANEAAHCLRERSHGLRLMTVMHMGTDAVRRAVDSAMASSMI